MCSYYVGTCKLFSSSESIPPLSPVVTLTVTICDMGTVYVKAEAGCMDKDIVRDVCSVLFLKL